MLTSKRLISSGGVKPGGNLETCFWISSLMESWICENREVEADGAAMALLEDRCQEDHGSPLPMCQGSVAEELMFATEPSFKKRLVRLEATKDLWTGCDVISF